MVRTYPIKLRGWGYLDSSSSLKSTTFINTSLFMLESCVLETYV